MQLRRETLRARRAIHLAAAIMVGGVPFFKAFASEQDTPTAPSPADWYYFGGLEAGGRFVFDRPPSGFGPTWASSGGGCLIGGASPITTCFLTPSQIRSRAKFEEYGAIPTAPFIDWINLQIGTKDGRFSADFWARSVGLNNQSYKADVSKPGEHYLSLGWDQIPFLISTSGKTVFGGVGSTFLTVNPALPASLQPFMPNAGDIGAVGDAARANIQALINNAETPLALGTRRDRAAGAYQWTSNPDWDFSVDYSHERRKGVRPASISYFWDTGTPAEPHLPIGLPRPINDSTQNLEARGEYSGTSLWGARWSTSLVYAGSLYHNSLKQLDAQNPFCMPGSCNALAGPFFAPNMLRLALDPSNSANAVTWNAAVDLPFWKTRYVSTVQFNDMRQNDVFIDSGTNGLIAPPVMLNGAPVGRLNGQIDTLLWNNVLTMRPNNDLKLTFRGRHYGVGNRTPSLSVADWINSDTQCASGTPNPNGTCNSMPRNSLPISYAKDNISAEARWSPVRWLGVGGGWFFERWSRTFRDVNVTNENSGKIFLDVTPLENIHARASYLYGVRRYGTYDTALFVLTPGLVADQFATNLRRFDVANRNRQKADVQVEVAAANFLTITPNFGLRSDDYPDPVINPLGLRSNHSWNAGVEIGAALDPGFKVMAAYNYENDRLRVAGGNGAAQGCPADLTNAFNDPSCTWRSGIGQRYHTVTAAADVKAIPNKLDLRFEGVYTIAGETNALTPCAAGTGCNGLSGLNPLIENFGQFPPIHSAFQRYNVIGRYYVDPGFVQQMGWAGDVVIKTRYTWVKNGVANYAIDNLTPYLATPDTLLEGGGRALFLASSNPNYSAHILAMSVELKW